MKTMVDTVKLLIKIIDPLVFDGSRFAPISLQQLVNSKPGTRTYLNPSPTYTKLGKYMPRLTMFKRFSNGAPVYQLAIEFSAPKILFDNNFDELTEDDFEAVLKALQGKVYELLGYKFFIQQLADADVNAWHPSKNVVFLDYTSSQTILNTIAKLDVSRVYDLQKTDFRDGHVVHIHCNSLDIAFYDKLAELRKAKISDKRAFENGSAVQMNLFDSLKEDVPFEVFRYELRFVGRASIKRAFPDLESWTFSTLYKRELCRDVLLKHWRKLTSSADMLSLDVRKPYELLQNYLIDNPGVSLQAAMAAVTGLLVVGQEGATSLRNLVEAQFGSHAWGRLKPRLKSPEANRFTHFQHIEETLEQFQPTQMQKFINNIEKSVN